MKTFKQFITEDLESRMKTDPFFQDVKKKRDSRMSPEIKQEPDFKWVQQGRDQSNANLIRKDAPLTVKNKPVDFTGSRYSAGPNDVKMVDNSLNQNWRSKREGMKSYQQPPGEDTPRFNRAKERMAAADSVGKEPPMPGAGPYKTGRTDPLNTAPIVPVTPNKPYSSGRKNTALAAKGYDATGKKVTAIPKQTGVGRAETPLPSNIKLPSGPGITTSGSIAYQPEKKSKQNVDRVRPSKQIMDRLPKEQRKKLDNTERAVPVPKPKTTGVPSLAKSKKSKEKSFSDVYKSKKEGEVFTWNNKKYVKKTKK